MPWNVSSFKKKSWYHSPFPWIGLAVAVAAGFLILPHAQRVYRGMAEKRRVARAEALLARGDFKSAVLSAKQVLDINPHNVAATRVIAKSMEGMGAPEALQVRRRLDLIGGKDVDNTLAIATNSLKAGDTAAAERALTEIPSEARDNALYHELAAKLAAKRQDVPGAISHWREAVRLDPSNDENALELAASELKSRVAGDRAQALQSLSDLSGKPTVRLTALRTLRDDAAAGGEVTRSVELAAAVAAEPTAQFADKLKQLTICHAARKPEFSTLLSQVQAESVADAANVFQLLAWMNEHNLALAVPDWAATLPAETRENPRIRITLADADARSSNWTALKERLENESWQEYEFMRFAFLARTLERLGDANGNLAAWSNAVTAVQGNLARTETLARILLEWGWNRKAEEILWKLAGGSRCPRWAADMLWTSALKANDSEKLYQASRLILDTDPKSIPARNNYVALALLTGHESDSPKEMAGNLYRQVSDDPVIATTYGLSLHQQGRSDEAVAVMSKFSPEKLREPLVALYQGIFLAGAGRYAEAEEFLRIAQNAHMLPEERVMFEKAKSGAIPAPVVGGIDRTRKDTAQLYKESRQAMLDDPKSVPARVNYVTLALLSGQNEDSARQLARALYKDNPGNASVATSFALSIYQQGKPEDALAIMETLKPEELRSPVVAAYYSAFLSAAGQPEKAAVYTQLAANATLLVEEKALLAGSKAKGEPAPNPLR